MKRLAGVWHRVDTLSATDLHKRDMVSNDEVTIIAVYMYK